MQVRSFIKIGAVLFSFLTSAQAQTGGVNEEKLIRGLMGGDLATVQSVMDRKSINELLETPFGSMTPLALSVILLTDTKSRDDANRRLEVVDYLLRSGAEPGRASFTLPGVAKAPVYGYVIALNEAIGNHPFDGLDRIRLSALRSCQHLLERHGATIGAATKEKLVRKIVAFRRNAMEARVCVEASRLALAMEASYVEAGRYPGTVPTPGEDFEVEEFSLRSGGKQFLLVLHSRIINDVRCRKVGDHTRASQRASKAVRGY